jgi:hypothetical protein
MQGLLAWVPILTGDNRATAEAEAAGFDDSRVRHVWDGERALADRYAKTLSLHCPAWDVYLLYEVGVRWDDTPPDPTFWTHQLPEKAGGQASSLLDPGRLASELRALLPADPGARDDLGLRLHGKGLAVVQSNRSGNR